jgi:DMSO reductase family type II enzyme heme b subunit
MRVHYLANLGIEELLDPAAKTWRAQAPELLQLAGTPVALQPTAAIRVARMGEAIGAVGTARVTSLHNGEVLAFRIEWENASGSAELRDNDSFPDAAAIALPVVPNAPLATMGAEGMPVNAWYWRADQPDAARQLSAEGLGTSKIWDHQLVRGRGIWKEGRWCVVLARSLRVAGDGAAAQLSPGQETGFGVVVWDGSKGERAGIKAFSGDWKPLTLDAISA